MYLYSSTRRAIHVAGLVLAPIRLVLPYAPGGSADVVGCPLAQRLYEKIGKQ